MPVLDKVTIDNLPARAHQDYARNVEELIRIDPLFAEAPSIAAHPIITSISRLYVSQWAELLGVVHGYLSHAHFTPPPEFSRRANYLFKHSQIIPDLFPDEGEEKASLPSSSPQPLVNLYNLLHHLDGLQQQIYGKLMQYQKG